MATSRSFSQLSRGVQSWMYRQHWRGLRQIQEAAIPIIAPGDKDVLITAPTAGGKTEAAFLPIVSWLEDHFQGPGYGALCLSPLKALINDQFGRLEPLCEAAHTRITPWHGDVSQALKGRSWRDPQGLLMITPESVEAMFIRRRHELKAALANVGYVVIDEFHAFIGTERGQQLVSLLARIEDMIGRSVCRIALSATIGDPEMALRCLRPDASRKGVHLDVEGERLAVKIGIRMYDAPPDKPDPEKPVDDPIAQDIFATMRGGSHLVFANSRRTVEAMTDQLTTLSEQNHVPLEFFAHHGSLSRDARHFVEQRLKEGNKPTTALATSTLELGIDIGDVESVGQIGAPAVVSSIRQRLGRSGRRKGHDAVLRVYLESRANRTSATPLEKLEVELVQAIAVIEIMLEKWVEPPDVRRWHLSTLTQQVVSMIAGRGDVTAQKAYQVLCETGPWRGMDAGLFARFLRGLGSADVISQLPSGELIVGLQGEKLASSHHIYTAFAVPEEYRIVANGKTIGTLPITEPYEAGQLLIFAGRRWEVVEIDLSARVMLVTPAKRGQVPKFGGEGAPVHRHVRERMREIYVRDDIPVFCDERSADNLARARQYFQDAQVAKRPVIVDGADGYWFMWAEDRVLNTVNALLNRAELKAGRVGPCVLISSPPEWSTLLTMTQEILADLGEGEEVSLAKAAPMGKFDERLPDDLLQAAFAAEVFDVSRAREYLSVLTEIK